MWKIHCGDIGRTMLFFVGENDASDATPLGLLVLPTTSAGGNMNS